MVQDIFTDIFYELIYLSSVPLCNLANVFFPEVITSSHADTSFPKEHKMTDLICTDISKNQHKGGAQRM